MTYKQKADLVAWWHFAIVMYGILGLPLMFFISWWHQMVFILFGFYFFSVIVLRGKCVITEYENILRSKQPGGQTYNTSFIRHYLKKILKLNFSKVAVNTAFGLYVSCIIIVAFYQALK